MSPQLQALSDEVAQNTSVTQSAIVLLQGLASQLAAAKDDPAAVAKIASDLQASMTSLANAVSANTPAAGQ